MSWYEKHSPKTLDQFLSNKNVVGYLKRMIETKEYSHFVLSGEPGSGKRTLIKIFLNEANTGKNVLWLNHLSLKTLDSKDKLNSFINSKSSVNKKWLIIENLHKMSSQFLYILYNILSSNSIVVCVLESVNQIDLSTWAMTFEMNLPSDDNFKEIGKYVLSKEGYEYDSDFIDFYLEEISCKKIYSFLFFLEIKKTTGHNIIKESELSFSYNNFLNQKDLKKRLKELFNLEVIGFSHIDIAMKLYRHITRISKNIEYAIEIGNTIEHLSKFEHDTYHLYACICRLWKIQENELCNAV
tara:strand:+ start:361 stop:1251 length:891 start_codon:yes stop_codon:yes gene_type:complete